MTSKATSASDPTPEASRTLRAQVRESLRQQIHDGQWRTGDRLPSESELMQTHAVSRITVRHALADLVAEGLIERVHGKGSFVAPGTIRQDLSRLQGLAEALEQQGRSVSTQVLSLRKHSPNAQVRQILNLAPDQTCMLLHTLRFAGEQVLSENHTWIHPHVAQGLSAQAIAHADLLTLYENNQGIRVARAAVNIQAALASQTQCERLQLTPPSAVLQVERTIYTFADQPLHHECSIYHPKTFSYRLSLTR